MEQYEFVEIGTKKYPIRFGFNALRKFSLKTGTTLADLDKIGVEMDLHKALVLIYCGIEDGYRKAKRKSEIPSVDDLADLIDTDFDAIGRCMDFLAKHLGRGNEKKKKASQVKKKK